MKEMLAYETMFRFLEERYVRLRSDALGALLGELTLAADGRPFVGAIAAEWNKAVDSVQQTASLPILRRRAG